MFLALVVVSIKKRTSYGRRMPQHITFACFVLAVFVFECFAANCVWVSARWRWGSNTQNVHSCIFYHHVPGPFMFCGNEHFNRFMATSCVHIQLIGSAWVGARKMSTSFFLLFMEINFWSPVFVYFFATLFCSSPGNRQGAKCVALFFVLFRLWGRRWRRLVLTRPCPCNCTN